MKQTDFVLWNKGKTIDFLLKTVSRRQTGNIFKALK